MRPPRAASAVVALVAACAALLTAAVRADDVDDQIAALKDADMQGDEAECLRRIDELTPSLGDARVVKAMKDLAGDSNVHVACAAVAAVAGKKDKDADFLKWLCAKLDQKFRPDGRVPDEMFKAVLDGLVAYRGDKPSKAALVAAITPARPKLAAFIADNKSNEWISGCASHAVAAYGLVRDKAGVEQLLAWGEQIEARGAVKGSDAAFEDEEVKRAVLETLAAMTGAKPGADVASWRKWWNENGKTFVFERPDDPPAAPPPAPAPAPAPTPAPNPPAPSTAEIVKAIKDLEKAGDEANCVAKMQALKNSEDPRALALMQSLMKNKSDKIACAAMNWITAVRDNDFYKWLVSRIEDKDLWRRKDGRPEVYKTVLEDVGAYLVDLQDRSVLKALAETVKRFLSTDAEYAARAVHAYGAVRDAAVVDQLIAWLEEVDSHGQSQGGRNESAETRKQKDASKQAILDTLAVLVGVDAPDAVTWKKFWEEKRKGFVFPDPHKKEADVDVTKLGEVTDAAFGLKLKRPDGPQWTFLPKDQWYRVQTARLDEKDKAMWWCHAGWGVYRPDSKIHDAKTYADWWAFEEFGKAAKDGHEFEEYAVGGEPKVAEMKFAGREWTQVVVKGKTKDKFANWGIIEKRVYITKVDFQLLYAVATTRSGAEPDDKKKLWEFIEGAAFVK